MRRPVNDTDPFTNPLSISLVGRVVPDPSDATPGQPDDTPTVNCSRCNREWDLAYELDDLKAGNQALEQFALDHQRHTGHFPDDVSPWVADCRRCPDEEAFLAERPARRWAATHARHTGHAVTLEHEEQGEETVVGKRE